MWSRNQYLNEVPAVSEFVDYFTKVLSGEISVGEFWPGYDEKFGVTRPTEEWRLQDLRYEWGGASLARSTWTLRPLRTALRMAGSEKARPDVLLEAMKGIFDWGMDARSAKHNHDWALKQGDSIVDLYLAASAELASDRPDYGVFDRARMNAGYTKVYAIPSLHMIIYDSRVAAGFCWLVRRFLLAHPDHLGHGLPPGLRFGIPPGLDNPLRDPSCDTVRFPRLSNSPSWAQSNVHASWIITEAIAKVAPLRWCRGPFALRRVEAALFMLGYRIDPENKGQPTASPKPRVQPQAAHRKRTPYAVCRLPNGEFRFRIWALEPPAKCDRRTDDRSRDHLHSDGRTGT